MRNQEGCPEKGKKKSEKSGRVLHEAQLLFSE